MAVVANEEHWWQITVSIKTTGNRVDELMEGIEDIVCPNAADEGEDHVCDYEWVLSSRVHENFYDIVHSGKADIDEALDVMDEMETFDARVKTHLQTAQAAMHLADVLAKEMPKEKVY